MGSQFPKRPAFGQIASIGALYDARKERFVTGSFFDKALPVSSISEIDIRKTACNLINDDTYEHNFESMGVGYDFGASILAQLVTPSGAGQVLDEKNDSGRILSATIHHQVLTVREKLDPVYSGVNLCKRPSLAGSLEATHAITEIEWGSQSTLLVRSSKEKRFRARVQALHMAVENGRPIAQGQGNAAWLEDDGNHVEIMAFSDILNDSICMSDAQKFREAYEFLNLVPTHVKHENGGKGKPVFYTLMPIPMLNMFLRTEAPNAVHYVQPSQDISTEFAKVFDQFDFYRRKWNDYQVYIKAHEWCVPETLMRDIIMQRQNLEDARSVLQAEYACALLDVRSGRSKVNTLQSLLDKFRGPSSAREITKPDESLEPKIQFIDKMVEKGATYIGYNGLGLTSELAKQKNRPVYVLFFGSRAKGDQQSWAANQALLLELLEQQIEDDSYIGICDNDAFDGRLEKAQIQQFENGKEVARDLVEERHFLADKCFARYSEKGLEKEDILKPVRRRFVRVACPGPNCDGNEICEWLCPQCMAPIEFGYSDPFFYCDCGRNRFKNYDFKCNGSNHGPGYERYEPAVLNVLLQGLDQSYYQNILILGETGVGKSTFINAFVNYLTFDSLEEAKEHDELTWVIPCSFSTQVMDRERADGEIVETEIKVGSRSDENDGSKGASATQQTIVHSVETGAATIRLIDTPGIGDTRGIAYDRKNMADILQTLSNYDELHGILILLKSNSSRLTISFIYCLKELLKHLHRSASRNMAFGFTNTRISNYTPGDTYGPLKALLGDHPDVGLSLTTHTTYCFDSESFRYLAAYKNEVFLDNEEDFRRSWQHSRMEALRLVKNFNSKPPHSVNSTVSLNGTRELISQLTKPMAEISHTIRANIALCADQENDLRNTKLVGSKLRRRIQLQRIQLHPKTLDKPRTVCTDASCVEYKDDGNGTGTVVTNYITHCHAVCYLPDVRPNTIAHQGLRQCAAFNGMEFCQKTGCGHIWTQHQHVLYELVEKMATVTDDEIAKQVDANASDVTLRQTAIKKLKSLGLEYNLEHKQIQQAAAQFGMFLKKNSLSPINDATIAYIDSLIEAEKDKIAVGGNKAKLNALTADRAEYIETINILTTNMNNNDASYVSLDEAGVSQVVQQLYLLPHFGKDLQNIKNVIAKAHQATYRERPHRLPRTQKNGERLLQSIWPKLPSSQPSTPDSTLYKPESFGNGGPKNNLPPFPTQFGPEPSRGGVLVKNIPQTTKSSKAKTALAWWR